MRLKVNTCIEQMIHIPFFSFKCYKTSTVASASTVVTAMEKYVTADPLVSPCKTTTGRTVLCGLCRPLSVGVTDGSTTVEL